MAQLRNKISKYSVKQNNKFNRKTLLWIYDNLLDTTSQRDNLTQFATYENDCGKKIDGKWELYYDMPSTFKGQNRKNKKVLFKELFVSENVKRVSTYYNEQYEFYKTMIDNQTGKFNSKMAWIAMILSIISIAVSVFLSYLT